MSNTKESANNNLCPSVIDTGDTEPLLDSDVKGKINCTINFAILYCLNNSISNFIQLFVINSHLIKFKHLNVQF
jgi:hypothetical protein